MIQPPIQNFLNSDFFPIWADAFSLKYFITDIYLSIFDSELILNQSKPLLIAWPKDKQQFCNREFENGCWILLNTPFIFFVVL